MAQLNGNIRVAGVTLVWSLHRPHKGCDPVEEARAQYELHPRFRVWRHLPVILLAAAWRRSTIGLLR